MLISQAVDPRPLELTRSLTADEVVTRYWQQAYRFAAMVARGNQESQDIAQEALMLVMKRLDSFNPARGSFEGWLWRIVINVARDHGRSSVRRASLFERLARDHHVAATADVEQIAIQQLGDEGLLRAVRSLGSRPRTLIALRFGAQLSYPEMGVQLGISEAAAIMATRRALATLRTRLKETRQQ